MVLTSKQEEGLKIAVQRYKNKEPYTVIAGYAGVGKSTLVSFIIEALNLNPDTDVAYIAYTGKASEVLRHKGCPNAMTAHKLLYYSKKMPDGSFVTRPRPTIGGFKVIIVDEVSMLPRHMWELLLTHNIHVIACGDPEQLPPVKADKEKLDILDYPHIFLDEVMRQAQDSEIIRLSMDIRAGNPISYMKGNQVMVLPYREANEAMYDWADQIICATNRTRNDINMAMRSMHGRGPDPEEGDKVISLSNQWEIFSDNQEANLINGTIGYLGHSYKDHTRYPIYNFPNPVPVLMADFTSESGEHFGYLRMDYQAILTGKKYLTPQQEYRIFSNKNLKGTEPLEFNYGYAITGHRAQGSEWGKVLAFEESFPFNSEEHRRWLYTVATRAQDKLVLITETEGVYNK